MNKKNAGTSWRRFFQDMWDYRQVLYFMVWRDFIVRYKQTRAGLWWAVLNPLLGLGVYWWAFGVVARMPSDNTPYPLFIFAGLIPFTFVSDYICRATESLTGSSDLIQKVFFPRIFAPLAGLLISLLDFTIMLVILLCMMAGYGYNPGLSILWLPVWLLTATFFALGTGLFLAAINIAYRDVSRAATLLTRLLLFASPVFYSHNMVPANQAFTYDFNPLSGVIQGFRWSLLGLKAPETHTWASSVSVSLAALLVGLVTFKRADHTVADQL